jgi:hypothetical protein
VESKRLSNGKNKKGDVGVERAQIMYILRQRYILKKKE